MARMHDIERRLLNWARWKIGGASGGLGYARAKDEHRVDGEGYDAQSVVPTIDCEADETDQAVRALEGRLRATLEAVYVDGGGMRQKAKKLCCTEATIHSRVDEAHRRISGWLSDKRQQRDAERSRVEALQRTRLL